MENLNDLALFAKVVEHKGFSAAGRHLGIPKSRLSRRVSSLEARLGVRLLHRSTHKLNLTSAGQLFYERCQAVAALGQSVIAEMLQATSEPQGLLRVTCPITLAQIWLTPIVTQFMHDFPRVRVLLTVTNRPVDPLEEDTDVVLRVRRPPFSNSSLVVRRLGAVRDVLIASAGFISTREPPSTPQDIKGWPTLSVTGRNERYAWTLVNRDAAVEIAHTPRFVTDDMFALKTAATKGLGVALLPEFICRQELQQGLLTVVLPGWASGVGEIQAVFASRRGMLPAMRAFVDCIAHQPPELTA